MNGIDEGVAKGEARGSHHKRLEIAKKMMAKGMDENTIMEITGLTQEEIRKLIS
jgi:predicted transposase/invertase (TIGR01784 family)